MLEFEKYKNEIIESIKNLELQQEKTNELLLKVAEDEEKTDSELEEETELEEEETDSELEEETELEEEETETELQTLIEQNEIIIEELQEMNQNQIESSWLIALTIIITLGFHYLINQFSKW